MLTNLKKKINYLLFTRIDQQAFLEDIAELIEDGVPAHSAVSIVGEVAKGATKEVVNTVLLKISQGQGLADGLVGWYPLPIVEIIRAGELGGSLSENIKSAARALSAQTSALSDLISTSAYPLAVLGAGLLVCVYVKNSVLKNFADIRPVETWPENGRSLYHFASMIEQGWWLVLILLVVGALLIAKTFQYFSGEYRQWFDKIPPLSLYRDVMASRFMETIGLLLINGMILKRALEVVRSNATPYIEGHIDRMILKLSGGRDNIAEVLDTGLIKEYDILRLKVIAKGKGFEHALVRLGLLSAKANAKRIRLVTRIFGGVLLLMGASLLAFMIFAVYGVGSLVGV